MKTKRGQQYLKTMLLALMEIYSLNIYTILCTYKDINNYTMSVESVIRSHHVYKLTWNPYTREKLIRNHDK